MPCFPSDSLVQHVCQSIRASRLREYLQEKKNKETERRRLSQINWTAINEVVKSSTHGNYYTRMYIYVQSTSPSDGLGCVRNFNKPRSDRDRDSRQQQPSARSSSQFPAVMINQDTPGAPILWCTRQVRTRWITFLPACEEKLKYSTAEPVELSPRRTVEKTKAINIRRRREETEVERHCPLGTMREHQSYFQRYSSPTVLAARKRQGGSRLTALSLHRIVPSRWLQLFRRFFKGPSFPTRPSTSVYVCVDFLSEKTLEMQKPSSRKFPTKRARGISEGNSSGVRFPFHP